MKYMSRGTLACALLLLLVGSARALHQDIMPIPGLGWCIEKCKVIHPDEDTDACMKRCKDDVNNGFTPGMCDFAVCTENGAFKATCAQTGCSALELCVPLWDYFGLGSAKACKEIYSKFNNGQTKP